MREYAKVSARFWTSPIGRKVRGLGVDALVVATYLRTAPTSSMTGLYYLPLTSIAHETGLSLDAVSEAMEQLSTVGFAHYDDAAEVVFVCEMVVDEIGERLEVKDKRHGYLVRELIRYRNTPLLRQFWDRYGAAFNLSTCPIEGASIERQKPLPAEKEAPSKGLPSPSEGPSKPHASPIEAPSKGLPVGAEAPSEDHRSQYQEQEQYQEQGKDNAGARAPTPSDAVPLPAPDDTTERSRSLTKRAPRDAAQLRLTEAPEVACPTEEPAWDHHPDELLDALRRGGANIDIRAAAEAKVKFGKVAHQIGLTVKECLQLGVALKENPPTWWGTKRITVNLLLGKNGDCAPLVTLRAMLDQPREVARSGPADLRKSEKEWERIRQDGGASPSLWTHNDDTPKGGS